MQEMYNVDGDVFRSGERERETGCYSIRNGGQKQIHEKFS